MHVIWLALSMRGCLNPSPISEELPLKIQHQVEKEWWNLFAVGALSADIRENLFVGPIIESPWVLNNLASTFIYSVV